MMQTLNIHSVGDLVGAIAMLRRPRRGLPLWYRGHRDATWSVTPALWRDSPLGRYTVADERNFTHRFRTRAAIRYPSTPSYDDHPGWLSLMQHYGLPTRLLDWSRSPLVAAYFALEAYLGIDPPESIDAAIWVLSPHQLNRRHADIDVTPAINSRDCEYLVSPAFRNTTRPGQLGRRASVIAAMATELDLRMFVQQGCFTVHSPESEPFENADLFDDFVWKLRIPREAVAGFAIELDDLGFRGGDLFPDLQNLATELTRSYPPGSVWGVKG
jgi:hypothetical protein